MTDPVLPRIAGSLVGCKGITWTWQLILRRCFFYQSSHMTLRRAMLKPSMCWTQQALALLTRSGWTSHPTMEALPILAFIASGCTVGSLSRFQWWWCSLDPAAPASSAPLLVIVVSTSHILYFRASVETSNFLVPRYRHLIICVQRFSISACWCSSNRRVFCCMIAD